MKKLLKMTVIATLVIVGLMCICGDPAPDTTTGEWLAIIAIGVAILPIAAILYLYWDSKGELDTYEDHEW